jgi:hypothetical protein
VAGAIHGMASWYVPTGPMELTAIVEQYVQMLTAGLAAGLPGLAQHDTFSFKGAFRNNAHLHG